MGSSACFRAARIGTREQKGSSLVAEGLLYLDTHPKQQTPPAIRHRQTDGRTYTGRLTKDRTGPASHIDLSSPKDPEHWFSFSGHDESLINKGKLKGQQVDLLRNK